MTKHLVQTHRRKSKVWCERRVGTEQRRRRPGKLNHREHGEHRKAEK